MTKFYSNSSAFTKKDMFGEDAHFYHIPASTPTILQLLVSSGPEVDLAPVIAMNFVCYKFFLYFSDLSRGGGPDFPRSTTGNASNDRSNLGYKQS